MNTWLDHWDRRYTDRVRLLVEILPVLAQEPSFALKGGTAINLFEHDLPRLSVDIDLAWLPVHDYAEDAKLIAEALEPSCAFLRSIEDQQPDFNLIGLPHAADLPAVRRKLHNLAQRTDAKRAADRGLLEETLARIAGARRGEVLRIRSCAI